MEFQYKKEKDLETRKRISSNLLSQNPDKIPIILQKDPKCKTKDMIKRKFLPLKEETVYEFTLKVRKLLKLLDSESLFLSAKGKYSITGTKLMKDIYDKYKDEDGFLYILVSTEVVFGCFETKK